jgi:hypothetical protein
MTEMAVWHVVKYRAKRADFSEGSWPVRCDRDQYRTAGTDEDCDHDNFIGYCGYISDGITSGTACSVKLPG